VNKYAQFDLVTGLVYAFTETDSILVGDNIVPAPDVSVLGKTWNGKNFV